MQQIRKVKSEWDEEKKKELVALGSDPRKSYDEILKYVEVEIANSKRMTNFTYKLPCFFQDGVYQLHRAIQEFLGASDVKAEKKPSSGDDEPMNTVDVILANGVRKKVPYGKIKLPDMGKDAEIDIAYNSKEKKLYVVGTCQFRFHSLVDNIMNRAEELLKTDSIYKDQAIEISDDNDGQPKILNLSNIDKEIMILSEKTEYALSPIYARILRTQECIKNNIPIKFGCIFEGPYGTGKTLLAFKLAAQAIKNRWSFIYLKNPKLLADTLRMAKTLDENGNGIIVFVEDIDQVTKGERNAALQDILNTIDGGDTKNMNVISLFTTNHIEAIEPTFLRGKRIGTIISMGFLDRKTAKVYINEFLNGVEIKGDLEPVLEKIERSNIAPAFMVEIIENAKTNMIIRNDQFLEAIHLDACVDSYLRQVKLSETKDTSVTKEAKLANALQEVLHTDEFFQKVQLTVREEVHG